MEAEGGTAAPTAEELAAKEAEGKETHEGFISLDENQLQVNKQHRKFRDAERFGSKETTRADAAEKELATLQAKNAEVVIPPVPDPSSENYAEEVQQRDKAIARKAELGAETTRKQDDIKREAEDRVATQDAAIEEKIKAFDTNMVTLGLNPATTKEAADTLVKYGISDSFQDIILEDPDGPLFVQYLANNPIELEEMNGMSTLQLVNHLNSEIRQKASLLKPETSGAPDPPITLDGGGVGNIQEDWEKGAKYE